MGLELKTEYAYFKEAFGGTVYTHQSFTFPTGAESWPLQYEHFNVPAFVRKWWNHNFYAAVAAVGTEVRFRFEYQPHPMLILLMILLFVMITRLNEITIPSQGNNTFSSFILYVVTPDVAVTLDLVKAYLMLLLLVLKTTCLTQLRCFQPSERLCSILNKF